jgi:hypothetical protein
MTDEEYAAFPLQVDAGGNVIQRPAVVPSVLLPLDANAMLRDGFNLAFAHHEAWVTVRAKLLAAVIKSVFPLTLRLSCLPLCWPVLAYSSSPLTLHGVLA